MFNFFKRFFRKKTSKISYLPNYNDRLDGYGAGEAESNDPVTHEKKVRNPEGISDLGIPNPYGEMDQYSFRDPGRIPLKDREDKEEEPQ